METKTFPFELVEAKAGTNGHEFTGYVSTFGNVDHGGDVVMPGAFDRTLREVPFRPFLWSHQLGLPPIGVEKALHPDSKGLLGTWELLDTQLGTDIYKALKSGALQKMSIGYIPIDVEFHDDVRMLTDVDLLESSLVNLPANDAAEVQNVKHQSEHCDCCEHKAVWSSAYINNLPDSAFAVILPGGTKDSEGKTTPRSLRKLPHHDSTGKLDEAHLNNALSREPQTDMSASAHTTAKNHLNGHKKSQGGGKSLDDLLDVDVPFDELLAQISGWLVHGADEAEALKTRRAEDERKLSDAHEAAIRALGSTALGVSHRLEKLLLEEPQAKAERAINVRLELARRRLLARGILEHAS